MSDALIPQPPVRTTGHPPRCKGCGGLCHQVSQGPAFDRVCRDCKAPIWAAARHVKRPIRVVDWFLKGATGL